MEGCWGWRHSHGLKVSCHSWLTTELCWTKCPFIVDTFGGHCFNQVVKLNITNSGKPDILCLLMGHIIQRDLWHIYAKNVSLEPSLYPTSCILETYSVPEQGKWHGGRNSKVAPVCEMSCEPTSLDCAKKASVAKNRKRGAALGGENQRRHNQKERVNFD